ncbi:MAG: signal peptidase II [Magnetococcales bacterium]|nr:signal peptidase II [Magnetococcales bacterium]
MGMITKFRDWMGVDRGQMRLGLVIALLVIVLDLASKAVATFYLADGSVITIIPGFFDFVLVHNLGAAFGLFSEQSPFVRNVVLLGVAFIAVIFIIQQLRESNTLFATISFAFILGGALGNVVDRLRLGWVVDFIHLHWYDLSWPVFNVADSAITVGVGMLIVDNFRNH